MKILSNKRLAIILSSALFLCLNACLSDKEWDDYPQTDADILSFSLSSDSVPALAKTVFTINQNKTGSQGYVGEIYNRDSLPYGTVFNHKVIVTYSNAYGINNLQRISNDTVWISNGDSLDISQAPYIFRSFPYNNDTTRIKKYILEINIHQIDPDSTQYVKIAQGDALNFLQTEDIKAIALNDGYYIISKINDSIKVYQSEDVANWSEVTLYNLPDNTVVRDIQAADNKAYAVTEDGRLFVSNDNVKEWTEYQTPYPVVSALGYLKTPQISAAIQKAGFCAVLNKDGQNVFGFTENLVEWSIGNAIPDNFPIRDISAFSREKNIGSLTLIGGVSAANEQLGTVWATQDGLNWAQLKTSKLFPALTRANIFDYDGKFRIINGEVANDGQSNPYIYVSIDGGITWQYDTLKVTRPDDYTILQKGAASLVSPDGVYYYILGGKDRNNRYLSEIWKCFINRKEFPADK
ncbi:MAG: DUF6242 domain-containing protein [Dysgonamonadaceae bacterium]|jgi:hypothetical protein|nr:DUF6242 domain-containing protein [Dysgonamonadaceae bacterium]